MPYSGILIQKIRKWWDLVFGGVYVKLLMLRYRSHMHGTVVAIREEV